jgi:hypothetical protein
MTRIEKKQSSIANAIKQQINCGDISATAPPEEIPRYATALRPNVPSVEHWSGLKLPLVYPRSCSDDDRTSDTAREVLLVAQIHLSPCAALHCN